MSAKRTITSILLSALFQTCKTPEPALYAPSIETIAFAGFAPQAVDLNQTVRSISITMPPTLADFKLKATVQLTPHTEISSGLLPDGTLDLSNYCPCANFRGQAAQKIVLRNTNDGGTGEYQLV